MGVKTGDVQVLPPALDSAFMQGVPVVLKRSNRRPSRSWAIVGSDGPPIARSHHGLMLLALVHGTLDKYFS